MMPHAQHATHNTYNMPHTHTHTTHTRARAHTHTQHDVTYTTCHAYIQNTTCHMPHTHTTCHTQHATHAHIIHTTTPKMQTTNSHHTEMQHTRTEQQKSTRTTNLPANQPTNQQHKDSIVVGTNQMFYLLHRVLRCLAAESPHCVGGDIGLANSKLSECITNNLIILLQYISGWKNTPHMPVQGRFDVLQTYLFSPIELKFSVELVGLEHHIPRAHALTLCPTWNPACHKQQ